MIEFDIRDKRFEYPNAWEELTPEQYLHLVRHLQAFNQGKASAAEVRVHWFCDIAGLEPQKFPASKREQGMENIYRISRLFDFIFEIRYQDGVLDEIRETDRSVLRKTPPEDLPQTPEVRYLCRQQYVYLLDAVFARNLIPTIRVGKEQRVVPGWEVNTSFDTLTTNISALQFIEATKVMERINQSKQTALLPLLASILYGPHPYSSEMAHQRACSCEYEKIDPVTLQAISLNFQALVNYLFTRTEFSILRHPRGNKPSSIRTGMHEMLYNLSSDGLGDSSEIEKMELVKFLMILRKKLIESVRAMADYKKKPHEIAEETDLPIDIINKILYP